MQNDISTILYSEEQIKAAVTKAGKKISKDFEGKNPLLVCILKGSVVFMADLMRAVTIPCEIDFMFVQSYGNAAVSSGVVQIKKDLETDIQGRHVILVEDILDSAKTLNAIVKILSKRNPASMSIYTFLNKKVDRAIDLEADYACFDVENEFVVGYGLDYAQKYRNLPYIGILKREIYS